MSDNPTNEEKMAKVKALLMQQLNHIYIQYSAFIKQLPIDENIKSFAIMNSDQSIMWVEQGLKRLQFQVEDSPNAVEAGKQQPCDQGEHKAGDQSGEAAENSGGDCPVECPEENKEFKPEGAPQ